MDNLTTYQSALICRNLNAFTYNFGDVRIEKLPNKGGFTVYYPADSDVYMQYCADIETLNGWLYGVVQGFLRREFKDGYKWKEV